jgi:hypothetical protein
MERARVILPAQTKLSVAEETLRIDVFWEALKNHSIESVINAFERGFKEFKWFPRPAEIIDFISDESQRNYSENQKIDSDHQLQWMDPNEQGRVQAKELFEKLYSRWDDEEAEMEKLRNQRFEERRKELKKQAKLLS